MSCCNKREVKESPKKNCPFCKRQGEYIHYLALQRVVKEELIPFVEAKDYFTCTNPNCEIVFYSGDEEQYFLIQDINLTSDFDEVTKAKQYNCGSCNGCKRH